MRWHGRYFQFLLSITCPVGWPLLLGMWDVCGAAAWYTHFRLSWASQNGQGLACSRSWIGTFVEWMHTCMNDGHSYAFLWRSLLHVCLWFSCLWGPASFGVVQRMGLRGSQAYSHVLCDFKPVTSPHWAFVSLPVSKEGNDCLTGLAIWAPDQLEGTHGLYCHTVNALLTSSHRGGAWWQPFWQTFANKKLHAHTYGMCVQVCVMCVFSGSRCIQSSVYTSHSCP